MATYKSNEQLPSSVSKPIQDSIAKIQAGISSLSGGGSSGSSGGSSGGYAVTKANAGSVNPADLPGAGSPRISATPSTPTTSLAKSQAVPTEQLDPSAPAPQSMIDQAANLQGQVNSLATQKGLKLQKTATGAYTAVADESALRNSTIFSGMKKSSSSRYEKGF